ncbi:MAG: hypothetical protein ACRDPC_09735 [Solirubrobacteraceae bacterium]
MGLIRCPDGTGCAAHLLITAHYGEVREDSELVPLKERRPEPIADRPGQGTLFAA